MPASRDAALDRPRWAAEEAQLAHFWARPAVARDARGRGHGGVHGRARVGAGHGGRLQEGGPGERGGVRLGFRCEIQGL
jgi:hypothetical protein